MFTTNLLIHHYKVGVDYELTDHHYKGRHIHYKVNVHYKLTDTSLQSQC
jgi:hypothetical protein